MRNDVIGRSYLIVTKTKVPPFCISVVQDLEMIDTITDSSTYNDVAPVFNPDHPFAFIPPEYRKDPPKYDDIDELPLGVDNLAYTVEPYAREDEDLEQTHADIAGPSRDVARPSTETAVRNDYDQPPPDGISINSLPPPYQINEVQNNADNNSAEDLNDRLQSNQSDQSETNSNETEARNSLTQDTMASAISSVSSGSSEGESVDNTSSHVETTANFPLECSRTPEEEASGYKENQRELIVDTPKETSESHTTSGVHRTL